MKARLRAPWFGRFARQVTADVLVHVLIATLAGVVLFSVVDFVEVGNRARAAATSADFGALALYSVPRVLQLLLPVAATIGTLTAVSALSRRREIVAWFAAGASSWAMAKPLIVAGLVVGVGYGAIIEWLVPPAASHESAVRARMGLPRSDAQLGRHGWYKGKQWLYRVRTLATPDGTQLDDVLMLHVAQGRLHHRRDLGVLKHDGEGWLGQRIVDRNLADDSMTTATVAAERLSLVERPKDFVGALGAPSRLAYADLRASTETRERLGRPALAHRIELYRRHTGPIIMLLVMVVAGALGVRLGRRQTMASALGAGAALGFSVWLLREMAKLMGTAGALPPAIAGHLVAVVLLVLVALAWGAVARHGVAER